MLNLISRSRTKAQSGDNRFTTEKVWTTRIDHPEKGNARFNGIAFGSQELTEAGAFEADFGARVFRKFAMVFGLNFG